MPLKDFSDFIERIKKLKEVPIPKALLECISSNQLMVIIDDILTNLSRQKRYKGLMVNSALRLKKNISGLPRTICILRGPDGKYQCILETKSKNNKDKKRKITIAEGGFKTGKPAWRLDGKEGPEAYFSLILPLKENAKKIDLNNIKVAKKLKALKAEINLPWQHDKMSGLQRNRLGTVYLNKKGTLVASTYSKKGTPLDDVNDETFPLTLKDRHQIAISLLKTTAYLHKHNIVFQDFKPSNILLFRKKTNQQLKVKLTDPGHVSQLGKEEISVATVNYESPEIALAHSVDSYYHEYFTEEYKKNGFSLGKRKADETERMLSKDPSQLASIKIDFLHANTANDMWALGMTLYELFKGKKPKSIPKDKHFAGFFAPRESRLTANKALDVWAKRNKP